MCCAVQFPVLLFLVVCSQMFGHFLEGLVICGR